ncbi:MAG: DUF4349 domain-containing protein [Anaerolineales bacterium]|nr:DUF4349 domain-containing protein [Anaerolineales bacterium]
MYKKIALLLFFTLLLSACSASSNSYAPLPMEAPMMEERAASDSGAGFAPSQDYYYDESTVDVLSQPAGTSGETTNPAGERIVIKNASLSIAVQNPAENLDAVTALADEFGGFVVSSNLYKTTLPNGAEVPQANITLRVPAARLDEALTRIKSGAGEILSETVSGQDVTREYTDLQSRLKNLEEAEAQLQQIMDSAYKTEDVINVFNQLTSYREQIEVVKGQIQYYETSAAFSAITVDILADAAVQPLTIGGWEPVGVAKDAIQALINTMQGIADATIWLVLYLLPVLVVIFIPLRFIWVGIKRWRKARRAKVTETPAA